MFPQLDLLIEKIVAVAAGDATQRPPAEAILQRMTQQGWNLAPAVQRLWEGERQVEALVAGLDAQEEDIILEALDLLSLAGQSPAELPDNVLQALAALPESAQAGMRAALLAQDITALQDAYQAAQGQLTPGQDAYLRQALADWVVQEGPQHTHSLRRELLEELPEAVRLAVLEQDAPALQAALNALPPEQAGDLLARLVQAGFFAEAEQQNLAQTVTDLEPVLQAIAAVAGRDLSGGEPGQARAQAQMDEFLEYLEGHDLHLRPAITAFWNGERDVERLCAGLPEAEQWVIQRLLLLV